MLLEGPLAGDELLKRVSGLVKVMIINVMWLSGLECMGGVGMGAVIAWKDENNVRRLQGGCFYPESLEYRVSTILEGT